jgi:hypothetical protein
MFVRYSDLPERYKTDPPFRWIENYYIRFWLDDFGNLCGARQLYNDRYYIFFGSSLESLDESMYCGFAATYEESELRFRERYPNRWDNFTAVDF